MTNRRHTLLRIFF